MTIQHGGSSLGDDADSRAHYSEGVLVPAKAGTSADPKPTAGKVGTQITVSVLWSFSYCRRKTCFITHQLA